MKYNAGVAKVNLVQPTVLGTVAFVGSNPSTRTNAVVDVYGWRAACKAVIIAIN